jgi:hypothetical protein
MLSLVNFARCDPQRSAMAALNGVQEVAGGDSHRAQDRAALGMQAPGAPATRIPPARLE